MTKDHVSINHDVWDRDAETDAVRGARLWPMDPEWGIWGLPETSLGLLPAGLLGMDAIELGCGTGYIAGWMARRGARVTAIDVSAAQLATARALARKHSADITFIEGNAEATGLAAGSFDFAISEYGAAIWCRPERWLREAWRLLRPGGQLVFLGNHPLSIICTPMNGAPCETTLHRRYRDMWGADWTDVEIDPSGVTFNLTISDWFALFREIGFQVADYRELYAPEDMSDMRCWVPAEWAKHYPNEQVWWLVKPG